MSTIAPFGGHFAILCFHRRACTPEGLSFLQFPTAVVNTSASWEIAVFLRQSCTPLYDKFLRL